MTESSVQPEDIHHVKTAECLLRNAAAVEASCGAGSRAKGQSCTSLLDQIMLPQSPGAMGFQRLVLAVGCPRAPCGNKRVYSVTLHSGNL